MRDAVDVDAAGGDVGRHQHPVLAGLEAVEGRAALGQRPIGMEFCRRVPEAPNRAGDLAGAVARAGEDQHRAPMLVKNLSQGLVLVVLGDHEQFLVDA